MKHRTLINLTSVLFFSFIISSCQQVVTDDKPGSHARISEILIVMDKELWQGDLGDTVRNYFGQFYPYLNQPEAWFSIIHRTPKEFTGTYSIYRNILNFRLEPNLDGGTIQREIDHWAKPQTVIQLNGPDSETLFGLFVKNQDAILQSFNQSEIRRLKNVMNNINKAGMSNQIEELMGLKISVPEGYFLAAADSNFVWARKVIRSLTQETAYWIATIEYTDTTQFNPANAMAIRDSIGKARIPVQDDMSFMGTEYRFGYEYKTIDLNGNYALETRGFWRTFGNHSMGGPFLNYLIHDEENKRLIMIDTYVFRPNEDKRDLVMQLEGIVHTLVL